MRPLGTTRSAIIVGGGIAGLAVGNALRRAGFNIAIYEQAPTLEPRGAALSLWPNAKRALRILGLAGAVETVAAPIRSLTIASKSGRPLTQPICMTDAGLIVRRTHLQQALAAPVEDAVHLGAKVISVSSDGPRPRILVDGRELTADLAIDASGIHSASANDLIGNAARFRSFGGVVAITETTEYDLSSTGFEWVGTHERAGLFPLTGNCLYWYFTRDQQRADVTLSLTEILDRTKGWPRPFTAAVANTLAEHAHQVAIYARAKPSRLGRDRVICVGDAAHGTDPTMGQGACQALEDAATLGELAKRLAPTDILPAFESVRLPRVRNVMARSSYWTHAAHGPVILQKLVRTITRLTPSALMERSMAQIHHMPLPRDTTISQR